jgi:hypothetical protein
MSDVISEKKWILLGFGFFNILFLFLPLARGEIYNYFVISLPNQWGIFLLGSLLYFPVIVVINTIFKGFYSDQYYDTFIKIMEIGIPILGIVALLRYRTLLGLLDSEPFTWIYYVLYGVIIVEHGINNYLSYKWGY